MVAVAIFLLSLLYFQVSLDLIENISNSFEYLRLAHIIFFVLLFVDIFFNENNTSIKKSLKLLNIWANIIGFILTTQIIDNLNEIKELNSVFYIFLILYILNYIFYYLEAVLMYLFKDRVR